MTFNILSYSWDILQILKPIGRDSSCAEEKYCKDGMQLPNSGRQVGFRRADLTVFSISSWNLARFPSKFLHIFKVSSAFHCIIHLNIRFIPSAMHKRRGKLSKKLFWAPKYTLSQITWEFLLAILQDILWRLRTLLLMYTTQKSGTFVVVEARNVSCPMEWGCPKNRSMTVSRKGQPVAGRTRCPVSLDTERKRYRPHGLHCSEQCRACARLARLCSAVVPAASRRAYSSAPPAVNRKRLPNIRKKKINTRTKQGRQSWEKRDPRGSFKTRYLKGLSPHKNPSP